MNKEELIKVIRERVSEETSKDTPLERKTVAELLIKLNDLERLTDEVGVSFDIYADYRHEIIQAKRKFLHSITMEVNRVNNNN